MLKTQDITAATVNEWATRFCKASTIKAASVVGNAILAGESLPLAVKGVPDEDLAKVVKSAKRVLFTSGDAAERIIQATEAATGKAPRRAKVERVERVSEYDAETKKAVWAAAEQHANSTVGRWTERSLRGRNTAAAEAREAGRKPGDVKKGWLRAAKTFAREVYVYAEATA